MRPRLPGTVLRATLLLTAGLGLAGCMVGPDFAAPPVALDAAWSSGSAAVTTPGPVVDTGWWRSLNDPQLNRIVETAATQNLSLQRAGVRVLQARATLAATVGDYYPQQQQLFGQLLRQRATSDTASLGGGSRSATLGRAGITVGWEIDFWGLFRRAIEAADGSLVASIADYDNAMVTLLGDTASTYVNLRTLEARVVITRANIGLQREGLRIASVRYREGATSERDPDQAESQLAETEAQLPALAAQIERTRNALAVLLGVTPGEVRPMLGPGAIPRPRLMVAAGVPAELVDRRPDLRAALAQAASQSALVGVNRAQLFPAVSVSGTFGILSTDAGNIGIGFRGDRGWRTTQSYAVGPAVTWSLLNWGQITNQVRAQDAVLQQALIGYQQAVLQAQREVEDGLANFVGAQRSAVSLRRAVAAQRRAARVALTQYEQGQTDYTTVITTQRILLQQEDTLAQTEAQIPLGLISIYKALGGGWEIREGRPLVNEANRRQMGLRTDWGPLLDYDDGILTPPPVRGLLPEPVF